VIALRSTLLNHIPKAEGAEFNPTGSPEYGIGCSTVTYDILKENPLFLIVHECCEYG